jgi:altronate dehydratase
MSRSIKEEGFAMKNNAVLVNPKDNIAVAIKEIKAGETVTGIGDLELQANEDIMRNHKVAIAVVAENDPVLKYGERIGFASRPIRPGDWVHSHNLKWEED